VCSSDLEKLLAELSFEASDKGGQQVVVDREYVRAQLSGIVENRDLSRYIL
jgi:ATP-dependent HslUV protease ATP-binding subunit HslU